MIAAGVRKRIVIRITRIAIAYGDTSARSSFDTLRSLDTILRLFIIDHP